MELLVKIFTLDKSSISVFNEIEQEKGRLFQMSAAFEINILQPPKRRLKMATYP